MKKYIAGVVATLIVAAAIWGLTVGETSGANVKAAPLWMNIAGVVLLAVVPFLAFKYPYTAPGITNTQNDNRDTGAMIAILAVCLVLGFLLYIGFGAYTH